MILFFPLGSILFLGTFENQLLASQENSMVQQGRLLSSALAGMSDPEALSAEAGRILRNLNRRVDSRIRVVDAGGNLLADTANTPIEAAPEAAMLSRAESVAPAPAEPAVPAEADPNDSPLYRIAVYPVNLVKKIFLPPPANFSGAEYYSGKQVLLGPEILAALDGRYGAATRLSSGGQVSVNLYSAIPIPGENTGGISGAVLVSRSSYGILLNLYRLRFDILKIFLTSLGVSLVLSLVLSLTITSPIKKLKNEAEKILDKSGHFRGHFSGFKRKDEIGDLSRSLSALSQKLEKRIAFIDNFTSDLLHEIKNPLAAIRGQTELALASPEKEAKLLEGIRDEEARVERFLSRLRELSRIDNVLDHEETETIDLLQFIPLFLETWTHGKEPANPGVNIVFDPPGELPVPVSVNTDRLVQVLSNPLENAVSFSSPGGKIRIALRTAPHSDRIITIDDEGPGIREENTGRYFERFYSERNQTEKENHSGLGLAIVRAIAEGYGGAASLENLKDSDGRIKGCRFTLTLPRESPSP
jgi:two-component system sensor histidine kinase ChvG